jgi:hypothetical protein
MTRAIWITGFLLFIWGCEDKAKPDYAACIALDAKNDVVAASLRCEAAIKADATSKSGQAAAQKLREIKPAVDKAMADYAAAQAQAAAEQARQAQQAAAARAQALRAKVHKSYSSPNPDGDCQGEGKPPYLWQYEGSTYAENKEVAHADGCKVYIPDTNTFCCPQAPRL